ncbi:MAG: lipoate--protein ligase family protein [Candidatus Bipolaricaulota bacterium]|nr:lipoate--protein ligase family protein [Candidatus Bipolaricaulota bacterium]
MRVLLDLAFRDPALNLALEEAILDGVRRELVPPTLRVWRNPRCVVVGRGQKPEEEVDLELARRWRIRVVVRPSGGGTVYHHPGNLLFSLFLPLTGKWRSVQESQAELAGLLAEAVRRKFGLSVAVRDGGLFVEGRKISGSAQLRRGALLHHGTLLLSPDVIPMERVLRALQPGYAPSGVPSRPAPVTDLSTLLGRRVSVEEGVRLILEAFRPLGELRPAPLSLREWALADQILAR